MSTSRRTLRQQLRSARRALPEALQQQAAVAIASRVMDTLATRTTRPVALYLANDGEPDTQTLIDSLWQQRACVTLPVIHPFTRKHLLFLAYRPTTRMVTNRYGIAEPALSCTELVPLSEHGTVLLPLVGFDNQGNRLGMGGGYYDRTLAGCRQGHNRPALIGLAHDCQQVEKLPIAPWDVPLDAIITPTQTLLLSGDLSHDDSARPKETTRRYSST